jgi:hypothetical protein
MSIDDIVNRFSQLTLHEKKTNDTQISSEMNNITNSLQNLTLQCINDKEVDDLCTQLDSLCLEAGVDSSLLKAIVLWFGGQRCGIGELKLHIPRWGDCR